MSEAAVSIVPIEQYHDTFDERLSDQQLAGEVVYTFLGRSRKMGGQAICAYAVLSEPQHIGGLVRVNLRLTDSDFLHRTDPVEGAARDGLWVPNAAKNRLTITTAFGRFAVDQGYFLGYNDSLDMSPINEKSYLDSLV